MPPPPIPSTFTRKKAKILQDLSVPDSDYSDKSPKGSVDQGIRELIGEINAYKGLVTTSSCAGRISVFLEGNRVAGALGSGEDEVGGLRVPGGKGGGKFLFVSHNPVDVSDEEGFERLSAVFSRGRRSESGELDGGGGGAQFWDPGQRFVKFAFEPMVRFTER
jgi:tRNA wybutosine-synthesizing protein 3